MRAVLTNIQNMGSGRRPVGASTITQQVAKNFLLTSDQTYRPQGQGDDPRLHASSRPTRRTASSSSISTRSSSASAPTASPAAALTYFDKSVNELTVAEAAYLAALPKGPSNYHPFRHDERAIERRNWVIDQMVDNGYVNARRGARRPRPSRSASRRGAVGTYLFAGDYFTEEVRREIIARYGEDALYEGGLSVRTTLDPTLQLDRAQGAAGRPDEV